jgi:WD40 repeat protein
VGDHGHRDAVVALDVRSDGAEFASCSIDGTIKVWSLETAALRARADAAELAAGKAAAIGANGREAAAGKAEAAARAEAKAKAAAKTEAARAPLVCHRPAATFDRLHYDADTKLCIWVDCVRYVGDLLLSRGADGRALLWQPSVGGDDEAGCGAGAIVLREFAIGGTKNTWYLRFALDASSTRLAMGNTRGEVLVWSVLAAPTGKKGGAKAGGAKAAAQKGAKGADAKAAAPKEDPDAKVAEDTPTTEERSERPRTTLRVDEIGAEPKKSKKQPKTAKESLVVRSTAISHDGQCVVCGCDDGSICVWEV